MGSTVHVFQIAQEQINMLSHPIDNLWLRVTARVHGRVNVARPAHKQQCTKKVCLHQRFTPRKRRTPTRLIVEDDVLFNLGDNFVDADLAADYLPGVSDARVHTLAAERAPGRIRDHSVGRQRYRTAWTCSNTLPTRQAPADSQTVLRRPVPALRIMAPPAAQRTSFEENGRSDTGTVMNGIPLDVEYDPRQMVG